MLNHIAWSRGVSPAFKPAAGQCMATVGVSCADPGFKAGTDLVARDQSDLLVPGKSFPDSSPPCTAHHLCVGVAFGACRHSSELFVRDLSLIYQAQTTNTTARDKRKPLSQLVRLTFLCASRQQAVHASIPIYIKPCIVCRARGYDRTWSSFLTGCYVCEAS